MCPRKGQATCFKPLLSAGDRSILPAYATGQGWTGKDKHGEEKKIGRLSSHKIKKPQYLQWDGWWHQAGERGNNIGKAVKQVILSHFCSTRWGGLNDISSKSDLSVVCVERVCVSLCTMNKYLWGDTGVCLHTQVPISSSWSWACITAWGKLFSTPANVPLHV